MAAGGRPRRARQGCIRAACLLLAVAGLVFTVLAGIKASMQAGLVAQRGPLTEDVLGPLANIFVCITFAWQIDKLGFLQLVRAAPPPFRKVPLQPHMRQTKLLTPGSAVAALLRLYAAVAWLCESAGIACFRIGCMPCCHSVCLATKPCLAAS